MMKWHDRVKAKLKSLNIRYVDVAARLGITEGAVSNYLNGYREPSIAQLKEIAAMCKTSLSDLVGDDAYFVTTPDEKRLIDSYRDLPDSAKRAFELLIESMREQSDHAPKK